MLVYKIIIKKQFLYETYLQLFNKVSKTNIFFFA